MRSPTRFPCGPEALREPSSAATAARPVGQPRQNVNYHVRSWSGPGWCARR